MAATEDSPRSTDELIDLGWSEASQAASEWFDEDGPMVVEGVAIPRALRKWLERNPGDSKPVDKVVLLTAPHEDLSRGQQSMTKGLHTVWDKIEPELRRRGVEIEVVGGDE
jgi:hypothetical protein